MIIQYKKDVPLILYNDPGIRTWFIGLEYLFM